MGVSTWPGSGRNKHTYHHLLRDSQSANPGRKGRGVVDRRAVLEHAEVDQLEWGWLGIIRIGCG
jgi:hypothetical protein